MKKNTRKLLGHIGFSSIIVAMLIGAIVVGSPLWIKLVISGLLGIYVLSAYKQWI